MLKRPYISRDGEVHQFLPNVQAKIAPASVLHQNIEELAQKWSRGIEDLTRPHEGHDGGFDDGYLLATQEHVKQLQMILAAKECLIF